MAKQFRRLPRHVAVIPDGNRRWAQLHNLAKEAGYQCGLQPALELYKLCVSFGIPELTYYGFTHDNTKRPAKQRKAFQKACVEAVRMLMDYDASLLVVGNHQSPMFPRELLPFISRQTIGKDVIRLNFLVNYDWQWDLFQATRPEEVATGSGNGGGAAANIGSCDVSRVDLVVRWGGRRRLSGLLPVQSVYADFYVVEDYWPDFRAEHFLAALEWYAEQDVTLGG